MSRWLWSLLLLLIASNVFASQTEQRFISLAPNITEIIYAAGAGSKLVAVSDYSNYPSQAKKLPRVANYTGIDIEKIIKLHPTRVFYWQGGNRMSQVEQLKQLGIKTEAIRVHSVHDVVKAIRKIGQLAGTQKQADQYAQHLWHQYQDLQHRYKKRSTVPVFYQVSASPLLTIGQHSYIRNLIQQCGGHHIINDTVGSAPEVNIATLLKRQPQAIIIGKSSHDHTQYQQFWHQWPQLKAVQQQHVFLIKASWINRPGPRLIKGMRKLCQVIDQARH